MALCIVCDGYENIEQLKSQSAERIKKDLDFWKFCKKCEKELTETMKAKKPIQQEPKKEPQQSSYVKEFQGDLF